jgi:hypothetical protein
MYVAQLLPTKEQADVLIQALREFSDNRQGPDQSSSYIADEMRLELLKQIRTRSGK